MEIAEIIRSILEKLKVTYIVISCLVVALVAKFITIDKIWLIITFCSVYLFLEFLEWSYVNINKFLNRYKANVLEERQEEEEEANNHELIWQHFISLGDKTLQVAIAIYESKMPDPNNSYLRLLPIGKCPSYLIYSSFQSPFDISLSDRNYIPCIYGKQKDNNVLITFNDYFYSLLENYIKTGKKVKL